jgi:large subunit ribosomal protein L18
MAGESKKDLRIKRKKRIRAKIRGTPERPRLCVFRSARHIYAQIIDDQQGKTLVAASSMSKEMRSRLGRAGGNKQGAGMVGSEIAARALNRGIKKVVFDRNGHLYHGRVKALADAARESGLDF